MDSITDDVTSCFGNTLCIWDWGQLTPDLGGIFLAQTNPPPARSSCIVDMCGWGLCWCALFRNLLNEPPYQTSGSTTELLPHMIPIGPRNHSTPCSLLSAQYEAQFTLPGNSLKTDDITVIRSIQAAAGHTLPGQIREHRKSSKVNSNYLLRNVYLEIACHAWAHTVLYSIDSSYRKGKLQDWK